MRRFKAWLGLFVNLNRTIRHLFCTFIYLGTFFSFPTRNPPSFAQSFVPNSCWMSNVWLLTEPTKSATCPAHVVGSGDEREAEQWLLYAPVCSPWCWNQGRSPLRFWLRRICVLILSPQCLKTADFNLFRQALRYFAAVSVDREVV